MSTPTHHDAHDHDHTEPPSDTALRVKALESLVTRKAILRTSAIDERTEVWRRAYLATPHGQPIELAAGLSAPA